MAARLPAGSALVLLLSILCPPAASAESAHLPTGGFEVVKEITVPGDPETVFDAFTLETKEWWDHSHSETPKELYFETRPGGGFIEIFDDEGNGALHATVIYSHRGKALRWTGPMGFNGYALELVHSLVFDPADEPGMTRLHLTVRGVGQIEEGWTDAVDGVWDHFLFERFRPYMATREVAAETSR